MTRPGLLGALAAQIRAAVRPATGERPSALFSPLDHVEILDQSANLPNQVADAVVDRLLLLGAGAPREGLN